MIAPVASLSSHLLDHILCYYVNPTATLQTIAIVGLAHKCFEQLVFPHQRVLFEAPFTATLEIRTCSSSGEIQVVHVPCMQLQVNQRDLLQPANLANIFDPPT